MQTSSSKLSTKYDQLAPNNAKKHACSFAHSSSLTDIPYNIRVPIDSIFKQKVKKNIQIFWLWNEKNEKMLCTQFQWLFL